nr:odorant receptor 18 [Graphosoma rubrolineatum]
MDLSFSELIRSEVLWRCQKASGMGMIWLENIKESLRRTRIFLSLSGMVVVFNRRLAYASCIIAYNLLALSLLIYSIYYYLDQIEKVSNIVHHSILILDACVGSAVGYFYHNQFDAILSDACSSYNYESQMMFKKMEEVKGVICMNYSAMFKYMLMSMIYLLLLMNTLAISQRYLNGEDILLLFPCYFPFSLDYYPIHIAVIIWQELIVLNIGVLVFSSLAVLYCVYSHVKSEIDILKFAMNNIEQRAYEMATNQKYYHDQNIHPEILSRCYVKCTRMCAEHHSDIIRYFNNGEIVIEIIYFLVFLTGLLVCTCTGFALISENTSLKIKFVGITLIQIIYLYIISWIAEDIAGQSQSVGDLVYVMEWYRLPKECQTILIIMRIRAGKPLLMRMLTGQKVDMAAFMALIKASYSYFNMMLATTQ